MRPVVRWVVVATALITVLLMALPVGAASWTDKVTGGGQAASGGIDFSITVSASDVGGQMQYSRFGQAVADLSMHATVECVNVAGDGSYAVAAGPAFAQDDPSGAVFAGAWMQVEVWEGGIGSGDRVRVRLLSKATADDCAASGSYPGVVWDGNFNIRSK